MVSGSYSYPTGKRDYNVPVYLLCRGRYINLRDDSPFPGTLEFVKIVLLHDNGLKIFKTFIIVII